MGAAEKGGMEKYASCSLHIATRIGDHGAP